MCDYIKKKERETIMKWKTWKTLHVLRVLSRASVSVYGLCMNICSSYAAKCNYKELGNSAIRVYSLYRTVCIYCMHQHRRNVIFRPIQLHSAIGLHMQYRMEFITTDQYHWQLSKCVGYGVYMVCGIIGISKHFAEFLLLHWLYY